ncbi:NAD-dependent succinate-semialdehyde dehydrogenase [Nocardioides psychrotolerans]|uniref:Succinate-semialdehyde dehydrogenase / glutarate-semialdehyde dehydrogenase n=1 Tax=Nocardioides psychrotolerans TaxID=1005945 RepID=A0A1I3HJK1_9ACTN|nr:NAD-dependent succinate-semialdehyde dehydrogenase [Nocardioides psychrotolerans]GEP40000.1 NAD-dependent succinate-semialdehyde dehydrogenase [Nocardioides psychrotolerans]SFI35916.1 succinate-semialdehyde dehydrogenase / glutarate-semialdehyde dehydrogenase [Nocardioides psychrotolerans]
MSALTDEALLASVPTGLFIAGSWVEAAGGRTFDVVDPARGSVLLKVADASAEDGMAALAAAHDAQESWGRTGARVRAEILRRAFTLVTERAEDFARLITWEMGKPLAESRAEVAYGAEFLRWFSEEAPRISGRYMTAPDGVNRLLVRKRPVGPCLLITPWNFPIAMATRKIAPALAAGCTMVLKPAELTPLTSLLLTQVLVEAGVPAGVLNVVTTTSAAEVSGPVIADPRLRKLSFTGSTQVGRRLISQAADQVLRVSMELGGNAPFIVCDDADVDAAVDGAIVAKMRNGGEACVAANRILVHRSVAEKFTATFAERMAGFVVGPGSEPGTTLGPLIDERSRQKVATLVDEAVAAGGTLVVGGAVPVGEGYFYPATVVTGVTADMAIVQDEIFGPVAPIMVFDDDAEAVRLANSTQYGLVAFVYTRDLDRALRLTERLEAGMLGINTGVVSNPAAPFGGVKASGMGREGGAEGIEEYLETVYIGIRDPFATEEPS